MSGDRVVGGTTGVSAKQIPVVRTGQVIHTLSHACSRGDPRTRPLWVPSESRDGVWGTEGAGGGLQGAPPASSPAGPCGGASSFPSAPRQQRW